MPEETKVATHTPGPWRISGNRREVYANDPDRFTGPFVVADCSGRESFGPMTTTHHYEKSIANAALIVRACNSFDTLVGTLKGVEVDVANVRKELDYKHSADEYADMSEILDGVLKRVSAAIQLATEGK